MKELEALISALKVAGEKDVKGSSGKGNKNTPRKGSGQRSKHIPSMEKIASDLEAMGVRVYGFDETSSVPMDGIVIWENLWDMNLKKGMCNQLAISPFSLPGA